MERSNIPLITCAILAAVTTGGPAYAFGIYSVELKNLLDLSQPQLDTLSSAYFCAGLFTWIPGLLVDRYGVRRAISCGGMMGATFMMAYWAVARQFIQLPSKACVIATLFCLGAGFCIANGLVIGAIYKILVCSSTPTTKGSLVGVAKGYVGMGSGVYACLFQAMKTALHSKSDLDFLPMAAVIALMGAVVPALTLLPSQQDTTSLWSLPREKIDKTTKGHFTVLYMGLLALAVMVMRTSLGELFAESWEGESLRRTPSSHISKGIVLLALWLGPILFIRVLPTSSVAAPEDDSTVLSSGIYDVEDPNNNELCEVDYPQSITPGEHSPLLAKEAGDDRHSYVSQRTETTIAEDYAEKCSEDSSMMMNGNYNLSQLLQTPHAWVLIWIALVIVGSGTMMTNNMGQMVESLALMPQDTVTPASMAIFSVAQATSRVVTGAVSDAALARYGIPRPAFLIVASLIAAVAHSVLALTDNHQEIAFLVGVTLSGVAFGMIWPLMVLIVGEVFGTAHMATNYLFYDGGSSAFGTLLLSKFVTQEVYEDHIDSSAETTCYGAECFQLSHWVVVALAMSCVVAALHLLQQTREVYSNKAPSIVRKA
ncbi:Nodulin-like [Seminavis robusta]|uniref:Nodulin-like n=1 Tax=Seminavis robusta TaxID=568900 RepID=A0A9N8HJ47_9STRA|nr:Nodulin-like [Seminavis robusta]|eukprot:Sro740_g195590.1 Nodulin-like (597) ;mRNA; f:34974-36764